MANLFRPSSADGSLAGSGKTQIAEAMSEVIAGRVDFFFGPPGLVLQQVREGKLVALVVNGAKRAALLPDLPTTSEAGFADAEYPIWYGLFLPVKTPRDIVDKLHRETVKALQTPSLRCWRSCPRSASIRWS